MRQKTHVYQHATLLVGPKRTVNHLDDRHGLFCKSKILQEKVAIMTEKTSEDLEFDHNNPLPYGGITDIHGNIIKAITKEEHDEMLERVRRAFRSKK